MGYTTEFTGRFALSRAATPQEILYINTFSRTRRMARNATQIAPLPDPIREAVNLPIGVEGAYYVGSTLDFGQDHTSDILDYNRPPSDQPALWCQWVLTPDGKFLEWDGNEKFYSYVDWLKYLIDNFFKPWDIELNGTVKFQGEDHDDCGIIEAENNDVFVLSY